MSCSTYHTQTKTIVKWRSHYIFYCWRSHCWVRPIIILVSIVIITIIFI